MFKPYIELLEANHHSGSSFTEAEAVGVFFRYFLRNHSVYSRVPSGSKLILQITSAVPCSNFAGRLLHARFVVQIIPKNSEPRAAIVNCYFSGEGLEPIFILENHREPIEPHEIITKMLDTVVEKSPPAPDDTRNPAWPDFLFRQVPPER